MAEVISRVPWHPSARANSRRGLAAGFVGLLCFSLFLLVRPFFDVAPAYRPRLPGTTQAYSFLVVAAFVPYAAAVWAASKGVSLRWAVGGTILLHALVLPAALSQSQDLYSYLFYGKMWATLGANPYVDLPLRFAADPWFNWVRWPNQPTVYGPLWTMVTAVPAAIGRNSLSLGFELSKTTAAVLEVATFIGLVRAAREQGLSPAFALLLVAWNPLVIVSLPLGGHADVALAAAWLWALVSDRRGHPLLATLLLTAATLVKAYAGLMLLMYLIALSRRSLAAAGRAIAMSLATAVLAWLPFWAGPKTWAGLARIGGQASSSLGGTLQVALGAVAPGDTAAWAVRLGGLAVVGAVIISVAQRDTFPGDPWPGGAAVFAAYLLVTPWFLPWHLVGLLALGAVAASRPLQAATLALSGTAPLTASFGGFWWGRAVQTALRYGIPATAAARVAQRTSTEQERRAGCIRQA
jgi:hypothetical protein